MSMFTNNKKQSRPYLPWKNLIAAKVMKDNHSEVKRIKENLGWSEANEARIAKWFMKMDCARRIESRNRARACLLLLSRIIERKE